MSRTTMKDVAKRAGVSVASVSYAFDPNKECLLSEDTKRRVLEAAREMNYLKNIAASGLREQRSKCIGLVSDILDRPRFSQIIQGAVERLSQSGYSAMLCPIESRDKRDSFVRFYLENRVDGFIYVGVNEAAMKSEYEAQILANAIPLVSFDSQSSDSIPCVHIDYFQGALDAALFLYEKLAVRRIVFISSDHSDLQFREQMRGLEAAVERHTDLSIDNRFSSELVQLGSCALRTVPDFIRNNTYHMIYPLAIRDLVKDAVASLAPGDGIICAWAGMEEYVIRELDLLQLDNQVIVLSQGYLRPELYKNLHYSFIPNHEIGYLCADMLMKRMLTDSKDTNLRERVAPVLVADD